MKTVAQIARFVVGAIFIFSGLIKLNDPVGTQIKFEEYFEVFAQDFAFMHDFWMALVPYALYLSVFMCAAEVILGVALLCSFRMKLTTWLLLAIVVFFTFLTFYSAYFNKVTDCGCFGDAIKLKPWTSFGKDIFLLVLILFMLWQRKIFKNTKTGGIVAFAALGSLVLAIYAIMYLPPVDLLAYRVGASIPAQMKVSEPLRYEYVMEKDGKTFEFEQYPSDTTYKYKDMRVLNENAKPKITDYRIWDETGDFTEASFKGKKVFIIVKNTDDFNEAAMPGIRKLTENLKSTGITTWILTSKNADQMNNLRRSQQMSDVPFYFADGTVLKTMARSNPCILVLEDGTVKGKWHYNNTPDKAEVMKLMN